MFLNTIRNIHFVGIGGSGMSGIAEVLLNSGYNVSGSDSKSTPTTQRLQQLGINIGIGHNAAAVENKDLIVISSAIPQHNPEILNSRKLNIPIIHRAEMLAELMRLKHGIVVAGTHGKTTTTSLIGHCLTETGYDPTVIMGGRFNRSNSSASLGKSDLFVAESDESDGSFLKLRPTLAVVTNIDRDHMDHYKSFDDILQAFLKFVGEIPFYGALCACFDDPGVQLLLPEVKRKKITFGLRPDADIHAVDIQQSGLKTTFTPVIFGKAKNKVTLHLPGKYNVSNSLACFAVGEMLQADPEKIGAALGSFQGVEHRFTVVGQTQNVLVIDDYAHNHTKINAVLQGTREAFPESIICAIFQGHRYTRLQALGAEIAKSFIHANQVVVAPIYSAGESPLPGITQESIGHAIKQQSLNGSDQSLHVIKSASEIENFVTDMAFQFIRSKKEHSKQLIIITLGAGDISHIGHKIFANIAQKE